MIKNVWKQVKIKTGKRLSLSIIHYTLNKQTRVAEDKEFAILILTALCS